MTFGSFDFCVGPVALEAHTLDAGLTRFPRLRPLGQPPSLALRLAARALALLVVLPKRAPTLISLSFPQCGHVYGIPTI